MLKSGNVTITPENPGADQSLVPFAKPATTRFGMPVALLDALDRMAAGSAGRLRRATDILSGMRGEPLPAWNRPWWAR